MIKLPIKLKEDIEAYCKLNEVEDSTDFAIKCTKDGLTLDKYGVAPFLPKSQIQEVPVEKEIVKEVIKEVLVEKEVIVEKNCYKGGKRRAPNRRARKTKKRNKRKKYVNTRTKNKNGRNGRCARTLQKSYSK